MSGLRLPRGAEPSDMDSDGKRTRFLVGPGGE